MIDTMTTLEARREHYLEHMQGMSEPEKTVYLLTQIKGVNDRLVASNAACDRLLKENAQLRNLLGVSKVLI
jgi:hypothetical protein